jgi:transaldolase
MQGLERMNRRLGARRAVALDPTLAGWGRAAATTEPLRLISSPLLAKLLAIGTEHVYADTADVEELRGLLSPRPGTLIAEVDGNTVNQPLVRRVLARYVGDEALARHGRTLRSERRGLSDEALAWQLYTAVCIRIGNDVVGAFAAGRAWEPSLQLHMSACRDRAAAVALGHALRELVPNCLVKVPFLPHAPACFLIARDLEREGVPVNFTSTFSARQAVAAALLTGATRTNVFMGRLSQGLGSDFLGEHVVLEAQRALRRLRRETGVKTRLIVASMRRWESFVRLAGCDVFTAPCAVLRDFLEHAELGRGELMSQLETSYETQLEFAPEALAALGSERIARLWRVEGEFVEFLLEYRSSREYADLRDGDVLARRCDDAGFGDLLYAPRPSEWDTIRRTKLPDLGADLTRRVALDTLYSLLADGDFDNEQGAIDAGLAQRLAQAA